MKYLLMLLALLVLNGCVWTCDDSEPSKPYPNPDDVVRYKEGETESVTYIYYCHEGKYKHITYITHGCTWEKSEVNSSGLCD
jgi:hypothetical protein